MMDRIGDKLWFQVFERCWRPTQGWGFTVAAVAYAIRPVVGLSFEISTFGALATAAAGGFITRAVEKHKRDTLPSDPDRT